MGTFWSEVVDSLDYNSCCGGAPNSVETEIQNEITSNPMSNDDDTKNKSNMYNETNMQMSGKTDNDSIESTESHYNSAIFDDHDTYTHQTPFNDGIMSPTSDKERNRLSTLNEQAMDFVDESSQSEHTLHSDKITIYDNHHMHAHPNIQSTESIKSNDAILNALVDNSWNYREIERLITFYEANNGIWDNLMFDEILSERHNDYNECIQKVTQIVSYKEKYVQVANYNNNDLWDEIQNDKRQLYRSESTKLVLSENLFKNMKEETLVFFLRGSKKSLHLSHINSDEMQMSGYIVGGEIINDENIPTQIHQDIKRVYYCQNNEEFVLNLVDNDGLLSISAYHLNSFECNLLANLNSDVDDMRNMYFSLCYDDTMQQFHILCGPKTRRSELKHVWCAYDILHYQNKPEFVELHVKHAPIIIVGDGQRFIFSDKLCMRYNEDKEAFVTMQAPPKYSQTIVENYNIVYVASEKRIYVFAGNCNESLYNNIWYLNINEVNDRWHECKLSDTDLDDENTPKCEYKCIQTVLCFGDLILIFAQSEKAKKRKTAKGVNNIVSMDDIQTDEGYIHYDSVYCLDLRERKMVKADYRLVGFGRDIIVTDENIIHCILQKAHCKIDAMQLIPDSILDIYKKRNVDLVDAYLRRFRVHLSTHNKKIIYYYLPVLQQ